MKRKTSPLTLDAIEKLLDRKLDEKLDQKFDEKLLGFATKEDLKQFATKKDLKQFATKEDLKQFATKEDLKQFATKKDLNNMEKRLNKKFEKYFDTLDSDVMQNRRRIKRLEDEIDMPYNEL